MKQQESENTVHHFPHWNGDDKVRALTAAQTDESLDVPGR